MKMNSKSGFWNRNVVLILAHQMSLCLDSSTGLAPSFDDFDKIQSRKCLHSKEKLSVSAIFQLVD